MVVVIRKAKHNFTWKELGKYPSENKYALYHYSIRVKTKHINHISVQPQLLKSSNASSPSPNTLRSGYCVSNDSHYS